MLILQNLKNTLKNTAPVTTSVDWSRGGGDQLFPLIYDEQDIYVSIQNIFCNFGWV